MTRPEEFGGARLRRHIPRRKIDWGFVVYRMLKPLMLANCGGNYERGLVYGLIMFEPFTYTILVAVTDF